MGEIVKFDDAAETFKRDRRVQKLLLAGQQPRDIAEELECSIDEVHASQLRMSGGVPPDFRARIMHLDLERLDRLHNAFWTAAINGDAEAAKICLRVTDHRDRLLGLYPLPTREQQMDERPRETSTERIRAALAEIEAEEKMIDGEVINNG